MPTSTGRHDQQGATISPAEDDAPESRGVERLAPKPSCRETMGSHVDKHLLPRFGHLPIDAVDERTVQEFVADLNRTTLAPKSIRNIIGVLKVILGKKRWQDWNLVLPEIPEKEQRYFTEDEMRKIINAAEGQWHAVFATMAGTGLRCGEVFGLHVEDLDL